MPSPSHAYRAATREEKTLLQHPVIDTHTHIGVLPNMVFTGEMALEAMDAAGVDRTIAIRMIDDGGGPFGAVWQHNPHNGNDYIADLQRRYPERIIGFCMVDVYDQDSRSIGWRSGRSELVKTNHAVEELRRSIEDLGMLGLFMHPDFQCYAANDVALVGPILNALSELQAKTAKRLPVLLHGVGNNMHYTVPEQIGGRLPNTQI